MNLENVKLNLETELVLNVGCPIGKTNAPRAYNALFSAMDMNYIMLPAEIQKGELPALLQACRTLGIHYLCPTMPHKGDIVPLLDDVDEDSRLFHSVNAVKFDADGKTHGVGMDGKGAVRALLSNGVELGGKTVLLYGAGGISGVIGCELVRSGAKKLIYVNRTQDKAEEIASILRDNLGVDAAALSMEREALDKAAQQADVCMQLTPLGMLGYPHKHEYLGFIDHLPKHAVVLDAIVNPPETETLLRAKENGLTTISGMEMLVSQMDVIFDYLFGVKVEPAHKAACIKEMRRHLGLD